MWNGTAWAEARHLWREYGGAGLVLIFAALCVVLIVALVNVTGAN